MLPHPAYADDAKHHKKGNTINIASWEADLARRSEAGIDAKYNLFQALVEPILTR